MCKRYIVVAKTGVDDHAILADHDDLTKAFDVGEKFVQETGELAHVYERVSSAKAVRAVTWEGRRRPGVTGQ